MFLYYEYDFTLKGVLRKSFRQSLYTNNTIYSIYMIYRIYRFTPVQNIFPFINFPV